MSLVYHQYNIFYIHLNYPSYFYKFFKLINLLNVHAILNNYGIKMVLGNST